MISLAHMVLTQKAVRVKTLTGAFLDTVHVIDFLGTLNTIISKGG